MSGQATGWVLRNGPHPDLADRTGKKYGARARGMRAVLIAVADASNQDGEHAHPGIKNVCIGSLYGRRQATKILGELVADGWLVVEAEGGGAGMATVYAIPGVKKGALSAQLGVDNRALSDQEPRTPDEKPRTLEPKPRTPGVRTNGLPTVSTNGNTQRASAPPDGAALSEVDELCEYLARGIRSHSPEANPKITDRWRTDMRLLLERGPTDWEPTPISERLVHDMIRELFTTLAELDTSGFCWADVVQSPYKLRKQWPKLRQALRSKTATTFNKNTSGIIRQAAREGRTVISAAERFRQSHSQPELAEGNPT